MLTRPAYRAGFPPPEAPADVQLLAEIRDLLKANRQDGLPVVPPRTVLPER